MFLTRPSPGVCLNSGSAVLDRGASAVEYGLLIAGIPALISIAVFAFGGGVQGLFSDTCDEVTSAAGTASC